MNLDGDQPVHVDIEILADVVVVDGQERKVDAGIRFHPVPQLWTLPVRWVRKNLGRPKIMTVEGLRQVTRPSRPEPDFDEKGSAVVAGHHYGDDADNPGGIQGPHELLHADAFVFHTPDGDLRYEVVRQPDKYVAGDAKGTKRVTAEVYAAGDTEVEHFFTLRLIKKG